MDGFGVKGVPFSAGAGSSGDPVLPPVILASKAMFGFAVKGEPFSVDSISPDSDEGVVTWGDAIGVCSGWSDASPMRTEAGQPTTTPVGPTPPQEVPSPGFPVAAGWPPSEDSRLPGFCRQFGIDAESKRVLKGLHPELQRRVLDEGPVNGPNTSLALMQRVHRVESREYGHSVSEFLFGRYINLVVEDDFRQLPLEWQRRVMACGPLVDVDPSFELAARIREVATSASKAGFVGNAPPMTQETKMEIISTLRYGLVQVQEAAQFSDDPELHAIVQGAEQKLMKLLDLDPKEDVPNTYTEEAWMQFAKEHLRYLDDDE